MKTARQIAVGFIVVLLCAALPIGVSFCVRQLQVYGYDAAYRQIEIGDRKESVVQHLGKPHNDKKAMNGNSGELWIERYLLYRVGTKGRGGVTWTIGIDAQGKVVTRHRDDNGC